MKSFRYFTEYVNASTPAFAVGGASTGPGMGQYSPVADLNAQKKKQRRVKQDPDIKDSPGTEPAKYYAKDASGKGMAKSTKQARDRHFTKGAAKDDDDPSAYKPAPGDKGAKTKLSKYTKKYRQMYGEEPRIPRKKGQPAGSDKHSDLYTDENPKGTIHGLGFKDVATAKASVSKIEKSGKTHAHKIQAAIAMEQRARVMGKTAEANVYRAYIEKMKKKTKEMQKEDGHTAIAKTNASQKRELERLKIKHDREDDRARAQDTARKNQETESLWDNIRKKKERIKKGSGEKMRKPGEKGAPTPAQIQRAQEDFELNEKIEGLVKKSDKSGIAYGILKKVYDRGMAAWRTGHRPGTTPQQWAFARVNSFITGGGARKSDNDLWKQHKGK